MSLDPVELPEYPGYVVYFDGRVYSKKRNKFLIVSKNNNTYYTVRLYLGKPTHEYIHRLVGLAFVPNPLNLPEINHKDGNKANNHYTNIEWVTEAQNIQHYWDLKKGKI